jgi:hypothetical protein
LGNAARAGATAVAAAAGLMALASTGQTPDGFVHANFGGPLGVFGSPAEDPSDVLAIGDGPTDPTELAALLQSSAPNADLHAPFRVAVEADSTPNATELSVVPTTGPSRAPIDQQSVKLRDKPVVDAEGRVDCRGAVSCETDPSTHVTKVTYPDGVVALVQKINDMPLIAYQNVGEALTAPLQAFVPALPSMTPPMPAAARPAPAAAAAPQSEASAVDPGPPAPTQAPDITASTVRPRVTVTRPPKDFNSGQTVVTPPIIAVPTTIAVPPPPPGISDALDAVKGAVDSVVGTIGKALGAGGSSQSKTGN